MIQKQIEQRCNQAEMGIFEHLADLRDCILKSLVAIVIASFVAYSYSPIFFEILTKPFHKVFADTSLIGTGPSEALTLKIIVSIFIGLVIALPYVFYQVWKFISPALYESERKWAFPFILVTTLCFLGGVAFCYEIVLPITFSFFLDEYKSIALTPQIRLSEELGFTIKALIAFGLIFELPVISFSLARFGLITAKSMISAYRYVIVGIFIVAAVLTPPDAVSQILMAGPMLVLYGISIIVVKLSEAKKITQDS
jgi:sec-independent protein translocase protein TatC